MFIFILLIIIAIVLFFIIRKSKSIDLSSEIMINGAVGSGKSLVSVDLALKSINKAHKIWWRRKYIWSHLPFFKHFKYDEMPLLYSNIPIDSKYYCPLTNDILLWNKRPHYRSVILIDESSLLATSLDYKDKDLSEKLQLFLKLVRQELLGSYRNIFGTYPNLIINTQSKNDNHFAFDRCINQVLYLTKIKDIPFFKIVYCRDLLLIDSVVNDFDDDIKESLSCRRFFVSKKRFKKYNSFCYEFLTHNLDVLHQNDSYININVKDVSKFYIPSFHNWTVITASNLSLQDILIEFNYKGDVIDV